MLLMLRVQEALPKANAAVALMAEEAHGTGLAIAAARRDLAPNAPVSARHGDKRFLEFGKQPRPRIRRILTHGLVGCAPTASAAVVAGPAPASDGRAMASQAYAVVRETRAAAGQACVVVSEGRAAVGQAYAVVSEGRAVASGRRAAVGQAYAVVSEIRAAAGQARAAVSEGRAAAGQACAVVSEIRAAASQLRATVLAWRVLTLAFDPLVMLAAASGRGVEVDLGVEVRFAEVAVGMRLLSRAPMLSRTPM